jgi:hypothetical protein
MPRLFVERPAGHLAPRLALLIVTVLIALAAWTVAAGAYGIESFSGSTTGTSGQLVTQAGAHPDVTTAFSLSTFTRNGAEEVIHADNPKDAIVELPPGLIGNPTATPKCTQPEVLAHECPVNSQIGTITVHFEGLGSTITFPLFNMYAPAGEPAEFAAKALSIVVYIRPTVRTGGDYGITASVSNISQTAAIGASSVTLWGVPADPSHDAERFVNVEGNFAPPAKSTAPPLPLMRNPTSCPGTPNATTLRTDSWNAPGEFLTASFDHDPSGEALLTTGCELVPFDPSITAQPVSHAAGAPTGLEVDLRLPQSESPNGLAESDLKKAVVSLPQGMSLSPSAAGGLGSCSPAEVALQSSAPTSCPGSSRIGSVEIKTPLLEVPLRGSVYLAQQGQNPFGSLFAIYITAEADGVLVKLPGHVEADPQTGRLTTTFDDNPQLPFEELKLDFDGGPRAPLVNPRACGAYSTTAQMTGWSGKVVESSDSFVINEGCADNQSFAPSLRAGSINAQAGAFSPFTITFSRADADQMLGALSVHTPPGLLGVLKSVVQCPEPQASQGACGPESLIGHTTVDAGPGRSPFSLGGQVFLTGPYKGAPFGLSVVVPAIAGPFNLGAVVVRASIAVDPNTAQLTVTSDPLPQILQGIPLDLQAVNVTIDRAGFMFNPTDCEPLTVDGTIQSAQNVSVPVSSPFQTTNCAALPFKPGFSVSTRGATSKANGASLSVKVTSGTGQANIGNVLVSLPKQLPSRLTTLQKACVAAVFEANPAQCPAASVVGSATAITPILAHPLTGPAYLVSHGGEAFPDLVIVLQGEGIRIDLDGKTNIKNGITSNSFNTVPDAPIRSFSLSLPEGPHSVLATNLPTKANRSMCGQSLTMPTTLTGQNGAVVKQTTKVSVAGCPKAKGKSKARKKRAAKSRVGRRGVAKGNSSSQK